MARAEYVSLVRIEITESEAMTLREWMEKEAFPDALDELYEELVNNL
jgi:hypothetical protein